MLRRLNVKCSTTLGKQSCRKLMPLGLGRKILKQSGENVESCLVKITFTHFYGILRKLRSVFCWLIDPGWTNECCYCHHNYITAQSLTQNPIYAHALNVVWLNNSWGCYLKRLQHRRSVCCLLHQINLMFLLYWAFFFIFILCLNVSYIELFLLHKKKSSKSYPLYFRVRSAMIAYHFTTSPSI